MELILIFKTLFLFLFLLWWWWWEGSSGCSTLLKEKKKKHIEEPEGMKDEEMLEDEFQTTTEKMIHVKFTFMENGKENDEFEEFEDTLVSKFVKISTAVESKVQEKKEFKLLLRSDHSILDSDALVKVLSSGNVGTTSKPLEVIVGE